MSGFTAGRVQVPVVPDLRGFQKSVGKGATGAGAMASKNLTKSTQSSFGKLGGVATKNLKRGLKFGGLGATITAGLAVKGGITRLMGIEDARASLSGLGHDAKSVDKIMANALASVKGTAFGMADAGKIAASSVAAGIKPGKELVANLKLVADAATIAKVPIGEMGAVFNKVASANKIQGDVIAQLNDQGIPIVQLLGKTMGKTSEEVTALASKGKIDFKTFSKAMDSGLGGAALKSGKTTSGAFKNMNAALGRVGANLLSGVFPQIAGGFTGITKALGPMEDRATVAGKALGDFGRKYGPPALSVIGSIVGALKDMAAVGVNVVKFLWDYKAVIATLLTGLLVYKATIIATRVAETALALWRGRQLIVMYAVTVAQRALNGAMKANVIGIVITAITLLVAGFVAAYKNSDAFRLIVNKTWAAIKTGIAAAWAGIKVVFSALVGFLKAYMTPAIKALQVVFKVVFTAIKIQIKVWWFAIRTYFMLLKAFLTNIIFPVIRFLYNNVVKPQFTLIGKVIGAVWNGAIKPVFSKMKSGVEKLKDAFKSAVSGIKKVWEGLKSVMAAPVNWVISNVVNKLIGAVNSVTKKFGGPQLKKLGTVGDPSTGRKQSSGEARNSSGGKGSRGGRRGFTGGKSGGKGSSGHAWPANTRALSSNYAGHSGLDIAAGMGSPIKAASNGTVEYTGWGRGFGQAIFVRGDDGLTQIYGHSSKVLTRAGAKVRAGQEIGKVGSTGNSTGPHLHFEIAQSAPGTTSNRAATLRWLAGAKMGKAGKAGISLNPVSLLKKAIAPITGEGAPAGWFSASGVASFAKKAIVRGAGKVLKKGASLASGISPGLAIAKKVFGGKGGIGGKKRTKAQGRALAKARKAKRTRLKVARALPKHLSGSAVSSLKKSTSGLTIGNLAGITNSFITGQIDGAEPDQATLSTRYSAAQAKHVAAANKKTTADRALSIARANNTNNKSVKSGKALAKAERDRTAAVKALAAAQKAATSAATAYRSAQDEAIERATGIRDAGIGLGSVSSAGFKTAGGVISNLRSALTTTKSWGDMVSNLIAAGLRGPILDEFINAGPSKESLFLGKSLLNSGGIGVINDLQNQLKSASIKAAAQGSVAVSGKGASGGGLSGSWSSSSAPYMSSIGSGGVPVAGANGNGLTIAYSGMPADTVDSIAAKTTDRLVREFSRPGA